MSDETKTPSPNIEPPRRSALRELGERWSRWSREQTTNRGAFVMGIVTGLTVLVVAVVLAGVASLLLHFFASPSSHVSGYVLISVAAICLLGSALVTWRLAYRYYRAVVDAKEADMRTTELERDQALKDMAELAPDREAVHRLGLYHSHVYNLISSLIRGDLALGNLKDETVKVICKTAESLLMKGTSEECHVSIWREPSPPENRRERIIDRLPVVGRKTFEIVLAPAHAEEEIEAFEKVNIDPSWLKWRQRNERNDPEGKSRIFREDNLQEHRDPSPDIEVFREKEYRSVRAVSFERDGERGYIVVLSKATYPFSDVEGFYAVWLRHVVELDEALALRPIVFPPESSVADS